MGSPHRLFRRPLSRLDEATSTPVNATLLFPRRVSQGRLQAIGWGSHKALPRVLRINREGHGQRTLKASPRLHLPSAF
jgi:hypothetical protein